MTEPARSTSEFRVRYAETDKMGVVYHANYLIWCEIARTDLIRKLGSSYAELEDRGTVLAVSEAALRYHASARYDDLVRAECWVEEVRSRLVRFGYEISRAGSAGPPLRLVTAHTTLIALDASGRPRVMPPELLARLKGG
ncbi:MAG TPA: thioesterase family protein [Longimicrobiaceae bacterium]|nr:thioesterase family protein [Longimicrobiaceae bacterium]